MVKNAPAGVREERVPINFHILHRLNIRQHRRMLVTRGAVTRHLRVSLLPQKPAFPEDRPPRVRARSRRSRERSVAPICAQRHELRRAPLDTLFRAFRSLGMNFAWTPP